MNETIVSKTSEYFKKKGIVLPKISELSNPHSINENIVKKLKNLDKDSINPLNLFRVHWFNKRDHSGFSEVPNHIVLNSEFTGVDAKICCNTAPDWKDTLDKTYALQDKIVSKYGDYCGKHNNMIKKHGMLRFNRIDEELPLNDNYTQKHLDWF